MLSIGGPGQISAIDAELARTRGYAAQAEGNAQNGLDRGVHLDEAVKAHERIAQLTRQRAEEESRIRQTSIEYHKNVITAAQQELGLLRQQQEAVQSRYANAQERFGAMGSFDQSRLRRLGTLVNEANSLRNAGKEDEARRIEQRFSLNDINAIKGVGLEGTDSFASRVLGDRAKAAGFEGVFGSEERNKAAEIAPKIERLIAETKVSVDLKVKAEMDEEQAKQALRAALEPVFARMNELAVEVANVRFNGDRRARDNAARDENRRRFGN